MNKTLIRGVLTVVTGIATALGVLPAELQETIILNAELAVGAVTVLWGVVATLRGVRKASAA